MAQISITLEPTLGIEMELIGLCDTATVNVVAPEPTVGTALWEMLRGPQGIPGTPGSAGGGAYTHSQSIALAVWTVAHNLGRYPSVTVTDLLGGLIVPDVAYLDADRVQITHGTPLAGVAYCN